MRVSICMVHGGCRLPTQAHGLSEHAPAQWISSGCAARSLSDAVVLALPVRQLAGFGRGADSLLRSDSHIHEFAHDSNRCTSMLHDREFASAKTALVGPRGYPFLLVVRCCLCCRFAQGGADARSF